MNSNHNKIRNIAIVAHVDHGKTTLVDKLLLQSDTLERNQMSNTRLLDSNDQEKERGITILAKNTAINWQGYRINIVDTPGHADFGGEVERVLSMVDTVLLLVDALDGPMPQTRFVTQKAFSYNLNPVLVINKIDRPGSRVAWVVDQVYELFLKLGATNKQIDFPIIYASALNGVAGYSPDKIESDLIPLFQTIVDKVSPPDVDSNKPLQMQISALDYSTFLGVQGLGKIYNGSINQNQTVSVISDTDKVKRGKITSIESSLGLTKVKQDTAYAGDIVTISGIEDLTIGDTICDPNHPKGLPALTVSEPTLILKISINDSPFSGKEGKYLTSRQILERLQQEKKHNVALKVEESKNSNEFIVSGRGELHLSVLIETLRRENFELSISRPEVIYHTIDNQLHEPYEQLVIDCEEKYQGAIIENLGTRKAQLNHIETNHDNDRVRLEYEITSRALMGFRSEFQTITSGSGIMTHVFHKYGVKQNNIKNERVNGVMVSMATGKALAYSLFALQERGQILIKPNTEVYEGMIIGIHSRSNDIMVNPTKAKKLDNMRSAGNDENIILTPPVIFSLEQAMEFIQNDELVEVTPQSLRLRKRYLTENERRRQSRK